MLQQGVENIWILPIFGAAEKSQGAAEKNKENIEAKCTGFSAEFFGSQSVEMFRFANVFLNP